MLSAFSEVSYALYNSATGLKRHIGQKACELSGQGYIARNPDI
jgi:hypothetical protein